MPRPFFEKEFTSTTQQVADTLAEALRVLSERAWCPADNFCIRLCLEEALVNAVVHGNRGVADRQVRLRIYDEGETCRVCVFDEGHGFDPRSVSMPDCNQLGGRGVCLIKEYMDDVRFNEQDGCLEMTFNRDTFSEACA